MDKVRLFSFILLFCLVTAFSGVAFVQIVKHERYKIMSEQNRLKLVPLIAPRGTISDRNGADMAKDALSYNVSVNFSRIRDRRALSAALSRVLEMPESEISSAIDQSGTRPYTPYRVAADIGIEMAIHVEEISMDHPGLYLEVSARREYPGGKTASNLLGYVGSINRSEFERLRPYGYRMDDLMGRSGIEQHYDDYIRGRHGGKQLEVDSRGREVLTLSLKEPVPGKPVRLSIDMRLQEYCDGLLEGKRGAIVAMDPRTGALLAMSSAPSYDPNIFTDVRRRNEVMALLRDEEYPMVNRAISGVYPPGSVFKLVIAASALDTGSVSENTSFFCGGALTLGGRPFNCWHRRGHGEQNLLEALKHSCNVYFWRAGMLLGVDRIAEYTSRFGMGERTGIDLPAESSGLRPSREWKKRDLGEEWYQGETLNYSVGQGYLLCTPLQVARMVSVFANGGYLMRPYVVESIEGVTVSRSEKVPLGISSRALSEVREGMKDAVNTRRGTGIRARQKDIVVSGKTGTAQTSKEKSHGWFGGFAPFDNAGLTVVVFDEYGGKGGYYAAETAGKVFSKARELGLL